MPFIAKSAKTGDRIDITQYDGFSVRDYIAPNEPTCQLCGAPLIVRSSHYRAGSYVSAHFAHKNDCDGDYESHPESGEHLFGKVWMRNYLRGLYSNMTDSLDINLEVPIPMRWRAKGRIADLLITWPMGWREVHEIQLASITPQLLEERTNDYERAGLDVYWWLGNRARTDANVEYCLQRFGQCYQIDIGVRSETVVVAPTNQEAPFHS